MSRPLTRLPYSDQLTPAERAVSQRLGVDHETTTGVPFASKSPAIVPSPSNAVAGATLPLELRFDGPIPAYLLTGQPTRAETLRGYIKGERRALQEQRDQLERFLAQPASDYRDAWLKSTRQNIASSEGMIAAWEAEIAAMVPVRAAAE